MDSTLTGLLERSARSSRPCELHLVKEGRTLPLDDLVAESQCFAAGLYDHGVRPGDRVGLILRNGAGFLHTLLGAVYAGAVPVPLALPSSFGDPGVHAAHVHRVALDCGMRHLVVGPEVLRPGERLTEVVADTGLRLLTEEALAGSDTRLAVPSAPDGIALIQYTSGSTSAPKGVVLTHRNVAAGLAAIRLGTRMTEADTMAVWLPLFHDMGLFSLLAGLTSCSRAVLWQPARFVREPVKWLTEFAEFGCTICPAPNFFYDGLLDVADRLAGTGLDLSSWRLAVNGAEPVQRRTVEEFTRRFAEFGLRDDAMFPVYGMAEATLAVTFSRVGGKPRVIWVDREELSVRGRAVPADEGTASARALVSVGRAVPGIRVRVAAEGAADTPEGTVGEIEISGTPVTSGYYRHSEPGRFTADGWLRTGDLGFLLEGELYVAGRHKDMIIIRGANYYAEDAEDAVRDLPDVYRNRCVAVPLAQEDHEGMALVVETKLTEPERRADLVRAVRARLRSALGLENVRVQLTDPHTLPRTSSGKVQRRQVKAALTAAHSS